MGKYHTKYHTEYSSEFIEFKRGCGLLARVNTAHKSRRAAGRLEARHYYALFFQGHSALNLPSD